MSSVFQFNVLNAYPPLDTIGQARIPGSDPFYHRGNDFLAPNFIGRTVSDVRLGGGTTYLGKNPSAKTVLNNTNGQIDALLAGSATGTIPADVTLYRDPALYGPVPDLGVNPGAMRILGNTAFFQEALTAPAAYGFSGFPAPMSYATPFSLYSTAGPWSMSGFGTAWGAPAPWAAPFWGGPALVFG